jgi:hypothetical protein
MLLRPFLIIVVVMFSFFVAVVVAACPHPSRLGRIRFFSIYYDQELTKTMLSANNPNRNLRIFGVCCVFLDSSFADSVRK